MLTCYKAEQRFGSSGSSLDDRTTRKGIRERQQSHFLFFALGGLYVVVALGQFVNFAVFLVDSTEYYSARGTACDSWRNLFWVSPFALSIVLYQA
jgi:hypothetical protein